MSKAERVVMYAQYLTENGFPPEVYQDEVRFKFEGGLYQIFAFDDQDYFRIVYPNFHPFRASEREKVEIAAINAIGSTKAAKVVVYEDNVSVAVELFFSPHAGFRDVFRRIIGALQYAVQAFEKELAAQ